MNKNLQDFILNQVRTENISVTVFLLNGFRIFGMIKSFDNYVIVLDVEGRHEMVYKHAISTIIPSKPLPSLNMYDSEGEQ